MASTSENVQINLKINGLQQFETLKDLNSEVIAQRRSLEKMKITDPGYDEARARLNSLLDVQRQWRNEIYRGREEQKSFWKEIAGGVAVGNLISGAIQQAGSWVKSTITDMVTLASNAEGVERAFLKLNRPGLLQELREATRGTVSDLNLMKQAVSFNNFGLPLERMGALLKFAQQRARDTGQSVDYLVDSIVTGIARKSPMILDNLGINAKRVSDEFKRTGDFAQAAFLIVNEEMQKAGESAETTADKLAKLPAIWENLKTTIGSSSTGVVSWMADKANSYLEWLNEAIKTTDEKLAELGKKYGKENTESTRLFTAADEKERKKVLAGYEIMIRNAKREFDDLDMAYQANSGNKQLEKRRDMAFMLLEQYKAEHAGLIGIQEADEKKRKEAEQKAADEWEKNKEKRKAAAEKARKEAKEADDERISSIARTAQALMEAYGLEISQTEEHFRKLKEKYAKHAATVQQLEKERVAKLEAINDKFKKSDLEKLQAMQLEIQQISAKNYQDKTNRELAMLEVETAEKLAKIDQQDADVREKIERQQKSAEDLTKAGKTKEAQILQDAIARELDMLDQSGKLREAFLKQQAQKEAEIKSSAASEKRLSQLESDVITASQLSPDYQASIEAEKALLDYKYELEIENALKTGQDTAAIEARYRADRKKLDEDYANQKRNFELNTAQTISDSIFSVLSNNMRAEADAKIRHLEQQRAIELDNKNLTDSQKKAINDKYEKKIKAERERAWKAEQRASIAQALINGALAVTKVLSQTGVLSPFAIPAIIAGTAAQVAVIAAQKPPQFSKGGLIPAGPSHDEGGISLINNRTGEQLGEMEGGEPIMILSKETQRNNRALINELLYNSQNRNGAPVSVNTTGAVNAMNYYRNGGIIPDKSNSTATSSTPGHSNTNNTFNTVALEEKMDIFIEVAKKAWSMQVLEENQNKLKRIRKSIGDS